MCALLLAACTGEETAVTSTVTSTSTTTTTAAPTTTSTSTATTTEPETVTPDGYVFVELAGEKVRLAIPESWVTVDLTAEDWQELLIEGIDALPNADQLIGSEAEALISQGGLLLAYDFDHSDEGFVTNLNILGFDRGPLDNPEVMSPIIGEQLEILGGVDVDIATIEVPAGTAIRARYGMPPETGFSHAVIQYYAFGAERVYVVTFSTTQATALEPVIFSVMETLESLD